MLTRMATQRQLHKVCVFCGSRDGKGPLYVQGARALGAAMTEHKIGLVYGGGDVGLMGEIARTVTQGLGVENVLGVIPKEMVPKEISGAMHANTLIVGDMHERKALMAKNADGFIAMPGGFGTLEELLEVITWQQIGFHAKPIGLLNIDEFWSPMLTLFDHLVEQGFVSEVNRKSLLVSADPEELLALMKNWQPPPTMLGTKADAGEHSRAALGEDVSTPAP